MTSPTLRTLALVLAAALTMVPAAALARAAPPPLQGDMTLGDPKAKVTVVEYASASCPHCARFNNNVFPEFKKAYIDTGKVHYVFREFLTSPVEVAAAAFLLARCAGDKQYFGVLDDFFHGQQHAYETGDVRSLIYSTGAKAGLSQDKINACLSDQASLKALDERVTRNQKADAVNSTPTFVIDGAKLPESDHEVNLQDLNAAIQPLLAARRR